MRIGPQNSPRNRGAQLWLVAGLAALLVGFLAAGARAGLAGRAPAR